MPIIFNSFYHYICSVLLTNICLTFKIIRFMNKKLVNVQLLLDCVISSDGDNVFQLRLPNGQIAFSSYSSTDMFAWLNDRFTDVATNMDKADNQSSKAD